MVKRTLFEFNRREPNLRKSEVSEVLPLYFQEEYPNLVAFLKEYYEALHEQDVINTLEYDLFALRDLDEVNLRYIDRLFYEIGNGASANYFIKPRLVGKLLSFLIKNKGNEFSANLFFRLFFDQAIEIQYPKNNLFIVAESPLNNTQYVIQDGAKYQFLSVLIRSAIPISRWESLYRNFVHTAGYYLSGDIVIEPGLVVADGGLAELNIMALSDSAGDEVPTFASSSIADVNIIESGEHYLRYDSDVISSIQSLQYISASSDVTISIIDAQYDTVQEFGQATSPTMDEDSDGTLKSVTMSNTIETMDNDRVEANESLTPPAPANAWDLSYATFVSDPYGFVEISAA